MLRFEIHFAIFTGILRKNFTMSDNYLMVHAMARFLPMSWQTLSFGLLSFISNRHSIFPTTPLSARCCTYLFVRIHFLSHFRPTKNKTKTIDRSIIFCWKFSMQWNFQSYIIYWKWFPSNKPNHTQSNQKYFFDI